MTTDALHPTQISILHSLRYAQTARFNTLMKPTEHTSDTFKFHVHKLMKIGYVTKLEQGGYQLTTVGKEFANNLDEPLGISKKQPKLSVLIVAAHPSEDTQKKYLFQERARNPHYGFWGEITDAVRWGESFEDTAARVLKHQTGLEADFTVQTIRRIRDYSAEQNALLEDKLFVIVEASNIRGELCNTYPGGTNAWITTDKLTQQKHFATSLAIIEELSKKKVYTAQDITYKDGEY